MAAKTREAARRPSKAPSKRPKGPSKGRKAPSVPGVRPEEAPEPQAIAGIQACSRCLSPLTAAWKRYWAAWHDGQPLVCPNGHRIGGKK